MNKKQLKKLIAEGRLEEAIRALLDLTEGTRLHAEALLLSARYAQCKQQQLLGTESTAELNRQRNAIAHALLQLVDELPEDGGVADADTHKPPTAPPPPPPGGGRMPFWFSVGAFAVLLAVTLLAPGWAGQNNTLFKTLLALAAAGVAATLPGFLHLQFNNLIKAGGALAAFVLVFLVNPAKEDAPGNFTVQMRPLPPSAQYPPLKVVELEIWNKNEWLKGKFSEEGVADFKNPSRELAGTTAALRWKAEYYRPLRDSLPVTLPAAVLEWVPDGSLERVYGKITDAQGRPLPGVAVEAEGIADTTDARGNYELRIPPALQKTHYLLNATAKGYRPKSPEAWPATGALNFSMEK